MNVCICVLYVRLRYLISVYSAKFSRVTADQAVFCKSNFWGIVWAGLLLTFTLLLTVPMPSRSTTDSIRTVNFNVMDLYNTACIQTSTIGVLLLVLHKSDMLTCRYKHEFGFVIPGRKILVDDVRIRGIGKTCVHVEQKIPRASGEPVSDMVGAGQLIFTIGLLLYYCLVVICLLVSYADMLHCFDELVG